jgi:hypothetical protein
MYCTSVTHGIQVNQVMRNMEHNNICNTWYSSESGNEKYGT